MSTTVRATNESFQSSDLSRRSGAVFAAADQHPVQVTRRDGQSLVLMSERESDARDQLLELAAQLIAAATKPEGGLGDRLTDQYSWMLALSPSDRETCTHEVLRAARASFATGKAHLAIAELTAWRETATAIAAGLGNTQVDWLSADELVERP